MSRHATRARTTTALVLGVSLIAAAPRAQDDNLAVARLLLRARTSADGDRDRLAADLIAGAAAHARTPAASVLVHACHEFVAQLRDPSAFADAARALGQRKDLHGSIAAAAVGVSVDALQRAGRQDEAAALLMQTFPRAVLVFGPFGDDGDNYLGKPFAPELTLQGTDKLEGRFGPITPRVVPFDPDVRLGRFPLRNPRTGHTGCFYALHQPAVRNATACYLELSAVGSFEVLVNGQSAGSFNGYADAYSGWHWLPIVLRKGTNQVLIKTALNGFDFIALRYVDGAGRPIAHDEPGDPARVMEPAPAAADEPPLPPPFVSPMLSLDRAARAAVGDDALVLRLATALAAAVDDADALALEHVLAVEAAVPTDLDTKLALACAYEKADRLPEELRRSRARTLLDSVREQVQTHAWATEQIAQHLADEDKFEDAIRLLQAAVDAKRAGPAMFARLHGFYQRLEFRAEATRLRGQWLELYPGDARAVIAEAEERQREGDGLGARDVLVAARGVARGDGQVNQRLLNLAIDQGDRALALAVHADIYRGRASSVDAVRTLAEVHSRSGDSSAATKTWQALSAHPEASVRDLVRAGTALLEADADREGVAVLAAALTRDPSQHTVRRLLRRLREKNSDDFAAIAPFRRDAAPLIAAFAAGDNEQGAASTLLLDQMIVEFHDDGSSVEETHQVRRINDLSGVEKFQEANDAARADEVVTLHTIAVDGQRYVPHRVAGEFSMPRLAPGVFVEEIIRRFKNEPGAEPWRGPEFHFQSVDEPYVVSELVVILPTGATGSFRVRNFEGSPERRDLADGKTAHVYTKRDVARLTPERLAPPIDEIVPLVTYGEDRTPGASARRAYDYLLYRTRGSTLVDAKARELTAGLATDGDKARAIHAFVHDTIPTSGGPSDPTTVLLRRQGPRFWLEVALLRAAEIPLQFATAARAETAAQPLYLGEVSYGVDTVVVRPAGADAIWIFQDDPRHWPLGRVAGDRMGAAALLLDEHGWTSTNVPGGDPSQEDGFAVQGEVVLDAQGTATFTLAGKLRGRDGFGVGDQLREREDNIKKLAARQVASQVLEGWAPKSVDLVLADKTQPLGLEGVLVKRRAVSAAGDTSLFDLPLGKRGWLKGLGDRAERKQPLALTSLSAAHWRVSIDPGEGFQLVELPRDVLVRHPLLDYAQTFRLVDGKVVVERRWLQRSGRLAPALYGEWLDLLRQLDLAEDGKLKLAAR